MLIFKARLIAVACAFIVLFGIVIGRLFEIQIINGKNYAAQSRRQTNRRKVILARRGAIRDRNGVVLAASVGSDVETRGNGSGGKRPNRRLYPHGELAAAVLGYVGVDGYGLGGVEYAFDRQLRGQNGWSILQRDGINNRYSRIDMPQKPTVDGSDVYLTLDIHIQKIVENVLRQQVAEYDAQGGMCIVMNPNTGEILAMSNVPGFDPNNAPSYSLKQRANNCISYNYEPGSTFKVIAAASALEEGVLEESDSIDGNMGVYEVYDQSIRDHKPYGTLSFSQALSYSSNVCFAKIADKIGSNMFFSYTKDFGFGAKSGIALPGEECGIVHPIERWSGRTRVTMAIGQEISATLLQMVMVFGAIARDGVLVAPRICSKIESERTTEMSDSKRVVRRVVSRKAARRMRMMLKNVVDDGTAKNAAIPGISIAGKTGTSQKIDKETGEYSAKNVWASFIGMAPAEKPELVCGLVIDEPANGEFGGMIAAPAFRKILMQIVSHPELEYAERILHTQPPDSAARKADPQRLPNVCALDRQRASELLKAENIPFEIIGNGDIVRAQSPEAGALFHGNAGVLLYMHNRESRLVHAVSMPDCIGKDLRDAINAVNIKGLRPYVMGAGSVQRQYPTAGAVLQASAVCTLYCSYDG